MDEDIVEALRNELAYCEQTGRDARADQVRAALADAGAPVEDAEQGGPAKRRAPARARKEDTSDKTPKERA